RGVPPPQFRQPRLQLLYQLWAVMNLAREGEAVDAPAAFVRRTDDADARRPDLPDDAGAGAVGGGHEGVATGPALRAGVVRDGAEAPAVRRARFLQQREPVVDGGALRPGEEGRQRGVGRLRLGVEAQRLPLWMWLPILAPAHGQSLPACPQCPALQHPQQ